MVIFEVIDKTSRRIYQPNKQWNHILTRHPYMLDYIEEIKETLKNPDKIINAKSNKAYYYKNYKYLKLPNRFILVIVKYKNGDGFIITAYLEERIK